MTQSRLPRRPSLPPQLLDPNTPVYFDDAHKMWNVCRYDDALRVMTSAEEFSQDYGMIDVHPTYAGLWAADPPRHTDLRATVAEPFRPQELARLAPWIRQVADELLDAVLSTGTGQVELMSALARPLTSRVICEIMGVDLSNEQRFVEWVDEHATAQSTGEVPSQPDMVEFMTRLLQERREHPQQGLVDDLLRAQANGYLIAGNRLSDWDLIGYLWTLLAAGFETTATGLGNMVLAFIESDVLQELRDDPALIPAAIEEALRWNPPFPSAPLHARKDIEIGGQQIAAGQMVAAWASAANRDPRQFPEPETFDIRRSPNRHLTFGWGRHRCLGAPLAQLELKTALEAMLDKLPLPIQVEPATMPVYQFGIVNKLQEAHFRFPAKAS